MQFPQRRYAMDRGLNGNTPYYNLVGQPDNTGAYSIFADVPDVDQVWSITDFEGTPLNSVTSPAPFPQDASWTGSTVTEIPGWELVGTRTGGASVWQYVYARVQSTATPQNPTIVLSGSADIAGAAAAFGGI